MIWSRIDQKTCLKCILTAGLTPIILETILKNDEVVTGNIEALLDTLELSEILCVLSTTSCFAPRVPDDVERISKLCKEKNIFHIINNAYGLQCSKITNQIRESFRVGRVDFVVMSTDKNFLVPVGGAIVASQNKEMIAILNALYPGRASMAPCLDLFVTFLAMGEKGYLELVRKRKEMISGFVNRLSQVAEKHGERMILTKGNTISFAITCSRKEIGPRLYGRRVSGTRFVGNNEKEVLGFRFRTYGASYDGYPYEYLTAACAIGITMQEIDIFLQRLDELFTEPKQ